MPRGKFGFHIGDGESHLLVQHEEMIDKVTGFVKIALTIAVYGLYDSFNSLFTDFLSDFVHALGEEMCCI